MRFEPVIGQRTIKCLDIDAEFDHSLFPVTFQHLLFIPQLLLVPGVVQDEGLRPRPEHPNVLHVHVEVEVASDKFRVLILILLVGVQGPQLGDEDREIVLDERITVDEGLK